MTDNAQAEMVGLIGALREAANEIEGWGAGNEAGVARCGAAEIERMAGEVAAKNAEIRRLRRALAPFARAEHIVASCDDRIRCTLTYPIDATETFTLGSLADARQALATSMAQGRVGRGKT